MAQECLSAFQTRRPLKVLRADLELVRHGKPAQHSTEDMLRLLHLDDDRPDGKSLGDRLMEANKVDRFCPPGKGDLNTVRLTVGHIDVLFTKVSERTENVHELELAKTLIEVAEKQIAREADICDLASKMYLTAAKSRPELVNAEVVKRLRSVPSQEQIMMSFLTQVIGRFVDLPPGVEIIIGHPQQIRRRRN